VPLKLQKRQAPCFFGTWLGVIPNRFMVCNGIAFMWSSTMEIIIYIYMYKIGINNMIIWIWVKLPMKYHFYFWDAHP
jgi:hypothetical protein